MNKEIRIDVLFEILENFTIITLPVLRVPMCAYAVTPNASPTLTDQRYKSRCRPFVSSWYHKLCRYTQTSQKEEKKVEACQVSSS